MVKRDIVTQLDGNQCDLPGFFGPKRATVGGNSVIATYHAQDRLVTYGEATYVFGPNGDLQSRTRASESTATLYSYDVIGNLTSAVLPDSTRVEYVIDAANRRVGKKVNGTLVQGFLYDGQLRIVAESDGDNAVVSRFVYGTLSHSPDVVVKQGVTYRVIHDHLGSVRLVVNTANGAVVQRMDYDEWGNVTGNSNPGFQPFGFTGGLFDVDTKLVRFGARDYDAETGRWTNKDPIGFSGGDTNLYAYVRNDPIGSVDPSGLKELPPQPSGLPPDWTLDPTHKDPSGERYRHPFGDYLDFHNGRPGLPGWKGKDHWHHNGKRKHLKPGDSVPDPAPVCEEGGDQPGPKPDSDDPTLRDWLDWFGDIFFPYPVGPVPRRVPFPIIVP